MKSLQAGDEVLRVRRWLPLQCGGGSSIFEEVSSGEGGEVLAFVEDVRCLMKEETLAREFKPSRTHLIVWGDLKGGRIKIVEGGVPVATLSTTAPQRRLSTAVRDLIQHAIC